MKRIQQLEKEAVEGVTCRHYHKNVKLANFCKKIATGNGQQKYILRLKRQWTDGYKSLMDKDSKQKYEHEAEFVSKLYNSATQAAYEKIKGYFERVFRVDKKANNIDYALSSDRIKRSAAEKAFNNFGGTTLINYLDYQYLHKNGTDPNAWLLIEIGENGLPAPIELPSSSVVDYTLQHGILYSATIAEQLLRNGERIKRFTIYKRADREGGTTTKVMLTEDKGLTNADKEDGFLVEIEGESYVKHEYETDLSYIPMVRFGYIPNTETDGKTFAPFWTAGTVYFKDLIDRKFQLDVSYNLHTFLQKVQYRQKCTYRSGAKFCDGGLLTGTNDTCPSCDGTGLRTHRDAQDVLTLEMPEEGVKTILKPSEIAAYIKMPFDIVTEQREQVERLPNMATKAVLGIDPDKETVSGVTATEVQATFGVAYDVLNKFADGYVHVYNFVARCILDLLGIEATPRLTFPNEFGLESEGMLLEMLKKAKEANAPSDIIDNIEQRLANKQNKGNSQKIRLRQALSRFMVFKHLSAEQADTEVSNLPTLHPHRIIYLYFDKITDRITEMHPDFAGRSYREQKKIFDQHVALLKKELSEYEDELNNGLRDMELEDIDENED